MRRASSIIPRPARTLTPWLLSSALVLLAASCSKAPAPHKGPVADVTVGPGLSVILDTSDPILVSVATLKGTEATPTYAGRLYGRGGTNKAGDKPADADIRLRFCVSQVMPVRGEPPTWFAGASEKQIHELTQPDAAEYVYTGGEVTLTVTSDGRTIVLAHN